MQPEAEATEPPKQVARVEQFMILTTMPVVMQPRSLGLRSPLLLLSRYDQDPNLVPRACDHRQDPGSGWSRVPPESFFLL